MQEVGDVLFVPSGWHHMVTNEAPTLSINHNWLNAHNVHWAWELLRSRHQKATQHLEDCRWGL
jgi:oxalate decarboxylase/phosphoglucose isomerase-like protein (cupin superfamily)